MYFVKVKVDIKLKLLYWFLSWIDLTGVYFLAELLVNLFYSLIKNKLTRNAARLAVKLRDQASFTKVSLPMIIRAINNDPL